MNAYSYRCSCAYCNLKTTTVGTVDSRSRGRRAEVLVAEIFRSRSRGHQKSTQRSQKLLCYSGMDILTEIARAILFCCFCCCCCCRVPQRDIHQETQQQDNTNKTRLVLQGSNIFILVYSQVHQSEIPTAKMYLIVSF